MPERPIRVSRTTLAAIAAALLALLAAAGLIQVTDDTRQPPSPTPAPTVQLGGPGHSTIPAPSTASKAAAAVGLADHAGSRWDAPLPPAIAENHQAGLEQLAAKDQLPLTAPDAAPTVPGCTSRFVRNYSSRGGVAPRELVAHYTVSRPGSGPAIVAMFDQARFAASSNFVIDTDGTCWYIVRDTDKAWTQASANPFSVSIEFVAMGTETGLTPAQLDKGGAVWAYEAKKWGIPLQLGKVTNCLPTLPGLVDHGMLGLCGGNHHDLRPLYGTHTPPRASEDAITLGPLLAAARRHSDTITSVDRLTCRRLNWWRAHGRPHGTPETNAIRRRTALAARGVKCTARGPVRAT